MKKIVGAAMLVLAATMVSAGAVFDHVRSAAAYVQSQPVRARHAALSDSAFAKLITRLSEPGGFFDSDNLISNETGYLHPIPTMSSMGVTGGGYIGVGPDQNYSYIAAVRPEIAFMIDIRRDAGLQHLLYKDLMSRSRNRAEFLCLLLGKPVPPDIAAWSSRSLPAVVDQLERIAASQSFFDSTTAGVRRRIAAMAHEVTPDELNTIEFIHAEFFRGGLGLQYSSLNRRASRNYPTLRSLLLERDGDGNQVGYLTSEDRFQYVKQMHARNLIVPVSGNLAGKHAVREIGRYLREKSLDVSVLYVSNVEFYLVRDQAFEAFAENVATLPRNPRSVIIRSVFDNTGYVRMTPSTPGSAPFSEQLLGMLNAFVRAFQAGELRAYGDIVTKGIVRGSGGPVNE